MKKFFFTWIVFILFTFPLCALNMRVNTFGFITKASVEQNNLSIKGTFRSFNNQLITGCKIEFNDKEVDLPLETPISKTSAEFQLFVPVDQNEKLTDTLLKVTPLFDKEQGNTVYYVINSTLPIPPQKEIDVVGIGEMWFITNHFLGILIENGGLKKTDHVLDIGCGVGRMAYGLAYYLDPSNSRLEGFDIINSLVFRAQILLHTVLPHFNFQFVDIYNSAYNPNGKIISKDFRFPYEDNSFDFIYLASVFTHMLPVDLRHYLSEIKRVLRPGGKCLMTCFLFDNESKSYIEKGLSTISITVPLEDCMVTNPYVPEAAVGYEKTTLLKWLGQEGFKLKGIFKGNWCGRTSHFVTYQDVVIVEKPQEAAE